MNLVKDIYLCPPEHLELAYSINPWMNPDDPFSRDKAMSEWNDLVNIYKHLIPENIIIVPAKKGLTELCFIGDSVFLYRNKAIFSRFAAKERYNETEYVMSYFQNLGLDCTRVPDALSYEGSGETMVWNERILVGYGQRSSKGIDTYLGSILDTKVIGLELVDPDFYHLDTAFLPINEQLIAIYEPAFSESAIETIKSFNCEILYLNEADANTFALNSIVIENDIIIHSEAVNFIKIMSDKGFTVHTVNISEFLKFGGGLKCLSLQHYI